VHVCAKLVFVCADVEREGSVLTALTAAASYLYLISPFWTFSSFSSSMSKKVLMLVLPDGVLVVLLDFLVHVILLSVVVWTPSVSSPPPYEMIFTEVDEVARASA